MEISNVEIARVGCCSEGSVRAAISAGRLDKTDLEDVVAFVLAGRLKNMGVGYMDDLFTVKIVAESSTDLHYEPDHEHTEW